MDRKKSQSFQPGTIDTTFATNGVYTFDPRVVTEAYGVTALADDQLLISASYFPSPYAVVKMHNDGSPDSDFGGFNNGISFRHFKASYVSHGVSSVEATGNKILLSGVYSVSPGEFSAAITRLQPNGSLDVDFGENGVATLDIAPPIRAAIHYPTGGAPDPWAIRNSCTITPLTNGKIIFSKNFIFPVSPPRAPYSVIGRLTSNGVMDDTFHSHGYTYITPELYNIVDSHLIQADGKIVVAGHLEEEQTAYLARFDSDGHTDSNFGVDGYINFPEPLNRRGYVTALVAHSEDKFLLITNHTADFPNNNGMLRSLNADGSADQTFNSGLPVIARLPGLDRSVEWRNAVEDDDGFIVLGDIGSIVLARYLKTGKLDDTFGENGGWVTAAARKTENLARQQDGKIVVVAQNSQGSSIVVRFWGSGGTKAPREMGARPGFFRRLLQKLGA